MPVLDFFRSRAPMYVEEAEQVLEGFLFDRVDRQRPLGQLSPGQVRRLLIATMVNRPSRMLVLDEPTNHLDFDSLDVVEGRWRVPGGALLVVTHDEELAARIGLTQRWRRGGGTARVRGMSAEAVTVTEVRVLEGPNLYFTRPSIKVSLECPGYLGGDRSRAARARAPARAARCAPRGAPTPTSDSGS